MHMKGNKKYFVMYKSKLFYKIILKIFRKLSQLLSTIYAGT